jgi:hypothetical protein
MSGLDWDYEDLARQAQMGLDRVGVSFFRRHGARVREDSVDFHGYEHVDLEVRHDGHRLHVRHYGPGRGPEGSLVTGAPLQTEEFVSTFDDRPTAEVPVEWLAQWLAGLPVGEVAPERAARAVDPDNPFAATPREPRAAPPPAQNPFLSERSASEALPNPFAPSPGTDRRQQALDWLRGDDEPQPK